MNVECGIVDGCVHVWVGSGGGGGGGGGAVGKEIQMWYFTTALWPGYARACGEYCYPAPLHALPRNMTLGFPRKLRATLSLLFIPPLKVLTR